MAITTRYFSTSSAGAADGTSWANRAALFSGGVWSTVITGFNFAADTLVAMVGPGTYTITAALSAAAYTSTVPSAAFPCLIHGCDSSGNRLTPPDPNWTSDLPSWDDSSLPVLATTTNIATCSQGSTFFRLVKFTGSGVTSASGGILNGAGGVDWCCVVNSTANSNTSGVIALVRMIQNSLFSMTGSAYRAAVTANVPVHNCKLLGVTGSSGNRSGLEWTGTASILTVSKCCISGFGGDGILDSSTNTAHAFMVQESVIANNGGNGIKFHSTASQTNTHIVEQCMITGNGAYGIDAQSAARVMLASTRLRDNNGNLNGFGSWPTDTDVYTTDSDDASEYVAAGSNNFQILNTATIWGSGYGVSEQAAAGTVFVIGG